jgi:hypothetical protein
MNTNKTHLYTQVSFLSQRKDFFLNCQYEYLISEQFRLVAHFSLEISIFPSLFLSLSLAHPPLPLSFSLPLPPALSLTPFLVFLFPYEFYDATLLSFFSPSFSLSLALSLCDSIQ